MSNSVNPRCIGWRKKIYRIFIRQISQYIGSLNSRCPDAIIGDTDILKNAPMHMLQAGLGDMLAKYISLAEWRIAHLITGEYYCERVAALVRTALDVCVKNAGGLLHRDEAAVQAVFDGLITGGVAMAYAGVSRPASGVEHYFSHVWDMRALEFGTPAELHGIQCAIGTLAAVRLYEKLRTMTPDAEKACTYVEAFDYEAWATQLRAFLGKSAETMIALEEKEGKYRKDTHAVRFARIQKCWPEILRILDEELPSSEALSQLLLRLGMPEDASVIGVDAAALRLSFCATKDIRDKYVLSRLAWDLGVLDELCALLEKSRVPLYGTALRDDTVSLRDADLTRAAVAVGSEGRGLSAEVLARCEKTIKIPISTRCESLNAAIAAGVVLWEMYR